MRGAPPNREVAARAARAAAAKQATEIVALDVHELIVITDFFVIYTASSNRQVKTVIEGIEESIRGAGRETHPPRGRG